jgi:hypothetical protein
LHDEDLVNSAPTCVERNSDLKTNFVLVDFENVQPKNVSLLSGGPFEIKVFLGANQAKPSAGDGALERARPGPGRPLPRGVKRRRSSVVQALHRALASHYANGDTTVS